MRRSGVFLLFRARSSFSYLDCDVVQLKMSFMFIELKENKAKDMYRTETYTTCNGFRGVHDLHG